MYTSRCTVPGAAAFLRGLSPLRRSRARFPLLSPTVTSSPGAGEVFPLRESQAGSPVAKVLGSMRKLPAVLLALPLGELSPQVTERAHAVSLILKYQTQQETLPSPPKAVPLGKVAANAVSRRKGFLRQRLRQDVYRLIYQFVAFHGRD